jgi:hypothetical protein
MTTRRNLSRLLILAGAGLSVFVLACGRGGDATSGDAVPSDAATSHEDHIATAHIPTRWATGNAKDLRTLVATSGTVFVGRVTELKETRLEDPFGGAGPSGNRPSVPVSLFAVAVESAVAGGAATGSTVIVEQVGGVSAGQNGIPTQFVLGGDEPLAVGARYLFFATTGSSGNLTTAPFGRFEVSGDGTLAGAQQWADLGAISQLDGLRVDEARRQIARVSGP